jgi:glutaredoxin
MRLSTARRSLPRLRLYTGGPECSLCEVAKEKLDELRAQAPAFELETVNIRANRTDKELKKARRLWQYDIPVLLLDGKYIMKHRINESRLLELLEEANEIRTSQSTSTS